jgi:hypothetical protein
MRLRIRGTDLLTTETNPFNHFDPPEVRRAAPALGMRGPPCLHRATDFLEWFWMS